MEPMVLGLVVLLFLAIHIGINGMIPALVAKGRGRDFWAWVIIGSLIGIVFALILVLVLPPLQPLSRYGRRHLGSRGRTGPGAKGARVSSRGRTGPGAKGARGGSRRHRVPTPLAHSARADELVQERQGPPPIPASEPTSTPVLLDGTYWVPTRGGNKGPYSADQLRAFYSAGKLPLSLSVIETESELSIALSEIIGG